MRRRGWLIPTPALACAVFALALAASGDAMDAAAVDVEVCAACHDELVAGFSVGPHAALDRPGAGALRTGALDASLSCTSCHGDPTAHLEAGGGAGTIFSFGAGEPHLVNAGKCMECHGAAHPGFLRSPHAMAGMDCQSCHAIHGENEGWGLLKSGGGLAAPMDNLGAATASCAGCHGAVFSEFEFNERHRLREGILDCQSCHDPHAAQAAAQLGGFKQQACIDCHADKGGPFVFEHGSSRVEGCVACHAPHGSPNRHMLKFQSVAELCYSCHAAVPGFHVRFTLDTQCTNCHSTIHGSNFHPAFLK